MFSLRPGIIAHNDNTSCTLLNPEDASESYLNNTATEILHLLIKGKTVDEIASHISSSYEISHQEALLDVQELVFELVRQGFLDAGKDAVYIPYTSWVDNNGRCLYFPTERLIVKCNSKFFESLESASVKNIQDLNKISIDSDFCKIANTIGILNKPWNPNNETQPARLPVRAVLIPTSACNLNCQYCYAGTNERPKTSMTKEMAKEAIDMVVSNSFEVGNPRIDISFMGGGEPTVNWDVLEYAVSYIRSLSTSLSIPYSATLTTNGYIDTKRVQWIAQNFDLIKISFDGKEEVQNVQRPSAKGDSFEVVSATLRVLTDLKANFLVRCTVTNESLELIGDSVRHILNNYTPNSIIINPVYVCGNCSSSGISSIDISKFCSEFVKLQKLGDEHGVDVVTPYDKLTYMYPPKTKYCGFLKGNCFITPDGYLSTCSEIDSGADTRSPLFFFGKWDNTAKKFVVNPDKLHQLYNITLSIESCSSSCKSGAFCPGPCLVRKITGTEAEHLFGSGTDPMIILSDSVTEYILNNNHSPESKIQCAITNKLSYDLCFGIKERASSSKLTSVSFSEILPPPPSGSHNIYTITKISS